MKPITIFAIPHAFDADHRIRQLNALHSWCLLKPRPEVLLFGDEEGIAQMAKRLGFAHIPHVDRRASGVPLISSAFRRAQVHASHDILCYVNSDIILRQDLIGAIKTVSRRFRRYVISGQRWDMSIPVLLNFGDPEWSKHLRGLVRREGKQHVSDALDYFVFRKGTYGKIPPFAVGRSAWDNWLILDAIRRGIPTIDTSYAVTVVHQSHPDHVKPGYDPDRDKNQRLYQKLYPGYGLMGVAAEMSWALRYDSQVYRGTGMGTEERC